ncbi:MAG: SDR family NAD(P)-dependent oxidoreductase, partial [Flavobacteriaceae bacterium]
MAHIIITGSSRGIGLAIAKQAAQEGHRVLALSRNAETVRSLGLDNLEALPFDITNPQSLEEADAWIDKNWGGKIDILINNAGVLTHKPLAQTTLEDFQSVYAVNVFGPALLMGLWAPKMGKLGHVVNISSMGGIQGSA